MSWEYANVKEDKLELDDKRNNCGQNLKSGKRPGAALCLGLLCFILLAVILALVAHNHRAIASWCQNLQKPKGNENLTSIVTQLQARFDNLTETKKERREKTGPCPKKWIEVNRECFYFSPKRVTKTWSSSKIECLDRGGRLVTIKTRLRLHALSLFFDHAWIGLSDRGTEDVWRWEDGTDLEVNFWMKDEPNNHNDNEDCAQLTVENGAVGFNDNSCSKLFPFICEASG